MVWCRNRRPAAGAATARSRCVPSSGSSAGARATRRRGSDASGTVTRAAQTPEGVGTLHLVCRPGDSEVQARRRGGRAPRGCSTTVPALLGDEDDPSGFEPHHDLVAEAWRRFSHWRVPRSGLVLDALVPAVIEQKVTGQEAFAGYRRARPSFRRAAPGPFPGLMAPPTAAGWAAVPSWAWLQASVDGARSRTVVRAAGYAGRLEEGASVSVAEAHRRLRALPGVGVWTAAEVAQRALGDPDSVSLRRLPRGQGHRLGPDRDPGRRRRARRAARALPRPPLPRAAPARSRGSPPTAARAADGAADAPADAHPLTGAGARSAAGGLDAAATPGRLRGCGARRRPGCASRRAGVRDRAGRRPRR